MKKIVEEEDARHVDAMHYAATVGIRVGRENLKLIETKVGFWPTVFECEKKGRIDSEDLELAGRNVKRITRWADPVDNITTLRKSCATITRLSWMKSGREQPMKICQRERARQAGEERSKSSRRNGGKLAKQAQIQVERLNRRGWKSTISQRREKNLCRQLID
jgi:hypothetical protein